MIIILDNACFFLAVIAGIMAVIETGRAKGHLAAAMMMMVMAGLLVGLMVYVRAVEYIPMGSIVPLVVGLVVYRKMQAAKMQRLAEED